MDLLTIYVKGYSLSPPSYHTPEKKVHALIWIEYLNICHCEVYFRQKATLFVNVSPLMSDARRLFVPLSLGVYLPQLILTT